MATTSDSLLGHTFDGYRLEKPLGAGGMASVYRALDVTLKRYVAIKVIAHDFRDNAEYRQRFEREAQSIARLEHPNIVRIYRFGEVEGMYYMAMQYVEGADLGSLIREYRSNGEVMPLNDVARVMQDIGAALDFAHSRDVIHRDVKSGNIMVDPQGAALLTDFGLALLGDIGTRGEILGSPHYISPEQAVSSANVVPQSDLYSLGVTLFEMLTGELPFMSNEVVELTMRHLSDPPPAPSSINAALSPAIDEVVLRALEKEPYDRYQTGAELSAALKAAVTQAQSEKPTNEGRRPSLVLLPDKVREQMQAAPLPPIAPTRPAAQNQTETMAKAPSAANRWRGALVFAALVFIGGLILILALRPSSGDGSQPTELAQVNGSPTLPVAAATEEPIATATSEPTLSPAPPTSVPFTAVIVPTDVPPSPIPPTPESPTPIPPTEVIPPSPLPPSPAPSYQLTILRRGEDYLIIANGLPNSIPLAPLRLGDERSSISGSEWEVETLESGQCVVVIKNNGNPHLPDDMPCTEVGTQIERRGPERFWGRRFNVYYNEVPVGTCEERQDPCIISFSG